MEKPNNTNFVDKSQMGKKFIVTLPEKLCADFMIKLKHDSVPLRKFFRSMVEGYLDEDPRLLSFLDQIMREERPKYQTEIILKERVEIKKIEKMFGLDPNEIDDIYDIMEEESDDY